MRRVLVVVPLLLLVACGGRGRDNVVRVDQPSFEPRRIAVQTLAPGPTASPTPTPSPTPTGGPTPTPVGPPSGASITSSAGRQDGDVASFCWAEQVGGASRCFSHDQPAQPSTLTVRKGEKVLIRIAAGIAPDDESIRPFQGTRSGSTNQQIAPALETDLTVDLPEGEWSMDLCGTWHGRGQPICWLFKLDVVI